MRRKGEGHRQPCLVIAYMTSGRGGTNVRTRHPAIVGTTHPLIPRGLAHVSKGRAERFVSDTGAIFRAGLHLDRYGRKRLKPENVARRQREARSW